MTERSKRFLKALLLFLCLLPTGSFLAQSSDYETAISLVQQARFDQAIPLLQRILDRSPNDLKARNLMGIALSAAGRREEANEHFTKALAQDSNFVPALKNLALNELAMGQAQDAKRHFETALKSTPLDTTCHLGLAEIAFAAHDFNAAVVQYQQSGELAVKDPQVTLRFADSFLETKQTEKAIALLEKIPWDSDSNAQFKAGVLLARLEKFELAGRRFELARRGFPDPYQVNYNLMVVLVKSRKYADAIRIGEETLAAGQRKAELYNLLAQAYENGGKTDEAYNSLRAAIELEPEDEANYLDLITLCLKHQNYELSLKIGDIGATRIPQSHRLHLQRGVVLALKGEYADAVTEFKTAGQLAPEVGLSQVALGFVLMQMGKLDEAIDLLRHQSEKRPDDAEALWFLGEALTQSGASSGSDAEKEAIRALEKSTRLNPGLSQPRALLGKILLRQGLVDRATAELEKALEVDPEDLSATYLLAQALQKKGDTARAKELFAKVAKAKNKELETTQRNLLRIIKSGPQ